MSLKDKLMIFIYRKMNQLENEREQLRSQLRYQPLDSLDLYEHMREDVRLSAWKEFVDELFVIIMNCK